MYGPFGVLSCEPSQFQLNMRNNDEAAIKDLANEVAKWDAMYFRSSVPGFYRSEETKSLRPHFHFIPSAIGRSSSAKSFLNMLITRRPNDLIVSKFDRKAKLSRNLLRYEFSTSEESEVGYSPALQLAQSLHAALTKCTSDTRFAHALKASIEPFVDNGSHVADKRLGTQFWSEVFASLTVGFDVACRRDTEFLIKQSGKVISGLVDADFNMHNDVRFDGSSLSSSDEDENQAVLSNATDTNKDVAKLVRGNSTDALLSLLPEIDQSNGDLLLFLPRKKDLRDPISQNVFSNHFRWTPTSASVSSAVDNQFIDSVDGTSAKSRAWAQRWLGFHDDLSIDAHHDSLDSRIKSIELYIGECVQSNPVFLATGAEESLYAGSGESAMRCAKLTLKLALIFIDLLGSLCFTSESMSHEFQRCKVALSQWVTILRPEGKPVPKTLFSSSFSLIFRSDKSVDGYFYFEKIVESMLGLHMLFLFAPHSITRRAALKRSCSNFESSILEFFDIALIPVYCDADGQVAPLHASCSDDCSFNTVIATEIGYQNFATNSYNLISTHVVVDADFLLLICMCIGNLRGVVAITSTCDISAIKSSESNTGDAVILSRAAPQCIESLVSYVSEVKYFMSSGDFEQLGGFGKPYISLLDTAGSYLSPIFISHFLDLLPVLNPQSDSFEPNFVRWHWYYKYLMDKYLSSSENLEATCFLRNNAKIVVRELLVCSINLVGSSYDELASVAESKDVFRRKWFVSNKLVCLGKESKKEGSGDRRYAYLDIVPEPGSLSKVERVLLKILCDHNFSQYASAFALRQVCLDRGFVFDVIVMSHMFIRLAYVNCGVHQPPLGPFSKCIDVLLEPFFVPTQSISTYMDLSYDMLDSLLRDQLRFLVASLLRAHGAFSLSNCDNCGELRCESCELLVHQIQAVVSSLLVLFQFNADVHFNVSETMSMSRSTNSQVARDNVIACVNGVIDECFTHVERVNVPISTTVTPQNHTVTMGIRELLMERVLEAIGGRKKGLYSVGQIETLAERGRKHSM
jgi:hypothetical protein